MSNATASEITASRTGSATAVIMAPASFDIFAAPRVREAAIVLQRAGVTGIVFDLAAVTCLENVALGVIAGTCSRLRPVGGLAAVAAAPAPAARLFQATGLTRIVPAFATSHEAVSFLQVRSGQTAAASRKAQAGGEQAGGSLTRGPAADGREAQTRHPGEGTAASAMPACPETAMKQGTPASTREIEELEEALTRRLAPVRQALVDAGLTARVDAALRTARSRHESLAYLASLRLSDNELIAVAIELGCHAWHETDPQATRERLVRNLASWQQ
jgi:anti-anti-sigma factor